MMQDGFHHVTPSGGRIREHDTGVLHSGGKYVFFKIYFTVLSGI